MITYGLLLNQSKISISDTSLKRKKRTLASPQSKLPRRNNLKAINVIAVYLRQNSSFTFNRETVVSHIKWSYICFQFVDSNMNVPAWASSNLCIGRSYDANDNRAGLDIFHPDIPIKTENVNTFSFRYKIVKSNEDVRDLLNISGDISLKIKANIFKVEGAGKYISNNNNEEGTTEVLAVMKCTTVSFSHLRLLLEHCQTGTWCTQCSSSMHGQREKSKSKGHLLLFCHKNWAFYHYVECYNNYPAQFCKILADFTALLTNIRRYF